MERKRNSDTLFTSPKNTTQVYPEDTQADEKDTLKPKGNKNFLQLPTRKNNFFFKSMKNLSSSKEQKDQQQPQQNNSKGQQANKNVDTKKKTFVKQNTSIIPTIQNNAKAEAKDEGDVQITSPKPTETQKMFIAPIDKIKKGNQEKKDSPMHLDPLMIYSPKQNGKNSFVNASMMSGERTRRRISNYQKSLFQKRVKNEDEFGGGPNGLDDKEYQEIQNFPAPIISEEGNFAQQQSQNIPPQIISGGESDLESHISSVIQKGRIFSNQRRATEMTTSNYLGGNSRKSSSSTKRKWNFVKKLGIVRKFIDKLQAQSSVYLFSRLTRQHVVTISDKAYVLKDESNISIFSFLFRVCASYFKNKSWLQPLTPESEILIYLNLFFMCCYTFLIYCIPLYVVFQFDGEMEMELLGRAIPLAIHFFDIFIKCNTAYYKQGNIVQDRRKIIKNYLKKNFFYDVLILIGFAYTQESSIIHLVILLKLRDLYVIEETIHQKFFISQNIQPSYTLAKLIYIDLFLAHMFSCGFIYVAKYGLEGVNWINSNNLQDSHWIDQYVNSLYFSIITMTTVGFGDIHPYNSVEKIYVSVVTMISSGIFGYTLSVIGGIMHEKFQKEAEYKRKKYDLNHYMSMRSITKSLQLKALKYLDYCKHKDDQQPLRGQDIVYHLSDELQKQIKRDFYGTILNQFKILNFNFTPQCLADLALRMSESYFGPGEIIYNQNNLDDRIFFVAKGRVELYTETSQKQYPYEIIQKGQAFGKDQFFGQPLLATSAKSVSFSLIVFCTQIDFKEVLMNYPEDYEKYCMMKDNLTVNSKPFQNSCFICKKLYHTISNCPLMHHVRKKEFIVHRYIHSEPMERLEKERRKYDKFNCLKDLKLVRRDLKKVRQNMIKQAKEKKLNHKINSFSSTSSSSSSLSSLSSEDNKKGGRPLGSSWDNDDRQFYLKTPKLKLVDGSVQIDSAYSDILSDSMSLSEYNNYFLNLEYDQIIKVNGVETIQEERSIYNNEDDQSQSYAYNKNRRKSAMNFQYFSQQPQPLLKEDLLQQGINEINKINSQEGEKNKVPSLKFGSSDNIDDKLKQNVNENTIIGSNKAAVGSNPKFETPTNLNKLAQQEQDFKEFSKKDTLAYLQNQEENQNIDASFNRQGSHKEPLLHTDDGDPNRNFNKQLSVKNVNNPSKFYKKELSLRQLNGQQVPITPYSNHLQHSAQQSSQFSLSSINDAQSSPKLLNNNGETSKLLSPLSKTGNTKVFFQNRPISSMQRPSIVGTNQSPPPQQVPQIPALGIGITSSGSGDAFPQLTSRNPTSYSNQPTSTGSLSQQQTTNSTSSTLFGPHNFRKPFLEKPARVNMKKISMMSDFNQNLYSDLESNQNPYSNRVPMIPLVNPQIAQIQANAQARRESYLSVNFNNNTTLNNSRRGTIGLFSSNPNLTMQMSKKQSEILLNNNNNNDGSPSNQIPLIKNIQIFSPKNSGSGHYGNSLMIPGTPISAVGLHPRMSIKQDMSLLMKNISPMHAYSTPMQSNIPRVGSYSYENNLNSDLIFIPLELDTIREYKKYFPEGNFSSMFKEKIKIMKLLSRKFSNNAKENPNLKKMIQKKLSKLNSISQKRSFLKQSSKFSGQSFQNNLNVPDNPRIRSSNITPNVSINGLK